ncbi:MAG: hypothetical protein M3457_04310 [Chloroflexota bacterium]|nr:hypothetical protein [Chloroflexota bacterium]
MAVPTAVVRLETAGALCLTPDRGGLGSMSPLAGRRQVRGDLYNGSGGSRDW